MTAICDIPGMNHSTTATYSLHMDYTSLQQC